MIFWLDDRQARGWKWDAERLALPLRLPFFDEIVRSFE